MATSKKAAPKKAAPKKAAAPAKKAATKDVAVKNKIVFNARQIARAETCLKKTGKITVGMKEIVFTKLPKNFDPPTSID